MYEDKTYEAILQEKLARVASYLDKREGSIIYDALAPNSLESAMLYIALDSVLNETFADTASREYLIKRCAERGIAPLPATYAVGVGVFNMNVPIGARFSCDKYNWAVTEKIEDNKFYLTCETAGADPGNYLGQLIPIDYIDGLTAAALTSISINGEDEESTDALRTRYLNSFSNQAYGFNRSQYIDVTEALPGVGGCKPYRAWNGAGTVKLVITDSNYQPPSTALVNTVQTTIDPTQNSGDGMGLAPIDHEVTVVGATGTTINIFTTLTFQSGWNLSECEPYIEATLDKYYSELNATWARENNLIVRIAQIEARLLAVPGIVDITGTKINNQTSNLTLDKDAVAVRGFSAMRNFNNLRTIDLKEYLPGVLKDVAEIRAVMDTETPEIQALWNAAEACMNDQFIQTATENGIARRESMLGISPYASDTLDDRRFRLQSLYTENVPYTRRSLKNWLETLCGKDGYVLTITTSNFNVDVKVALGVKNQENVIRETLERMLPYNMTFSVSLLYNIWGSAKTKTWGSVKTKTWQNLKEEVSA